MTSFTPYEVSGAVDRKAIAPVGRSRVPTGIVIDKTCRVYITQIPVSRIERDGASALRAEFEIFGPLESYKMFTEKSGRFIGSALCTYRNPADAALAVTNMDGQVIDETPLKVTLARDHGVMLLHQDSGARQRGFLHRDDADDGEKWHHDKYEMLAEGKDMDEVLGRKRSNWRGGRGRGGGGYMARMERTNDEFERYIADRDAIFRKEAQSEYAPPENSAEAEKAEDAEAQQKRAMEEETTADDNASPAGAAMPPTALS